MRPELPSDEALVQRLPLPLAQLYRRAHNAKTALDRYLSAFYLWEASLKLLGSVAIVTYAEQDNHDPALVERLSNLARPALGHWWEFVRMLTPALAEAGSHGFEAVRDLLLGRSRDDMPRAAGLDVALREALDGTRSARATVRLSDLFDRLLTYKNREIGHGAAGQRAAEFYERMGPAMLSGVAEVLSRLDVLAGRSLLYVADVRRGGPSTWLVERYDLSGETARRIETQEVPIAQAGSLPTPGWVYAQLPGEAGAGRHQALHPLVLYDAEPAVVLFFNNRRGEGRAEYICYTTGEVVRRDDLGGEQRELLARLLGTSADGAAPEAWAARSQAEEPPPAIRAPAPRALGDFELLSELGRGGMSVVYRAWQPSLGRQVALKCLSRSGDPKSEARFRREIQALARVDHRNIVKIFTSGADGEQWFYAMELVEGSDLATVCNYLASGAAGRPENAGWEGALAAARAAARRRERPLDGTIPRAGEPDTPAEPSAAAPASQGYIRHAVDLVRQVAGAAHALHEAGVIHRDIKPGNILLTADGSQAVLMDLGLAQLQDEEQGRLTRTRQFVGTLRYASPEQVLAVVRLDRRSDVYNLGATLWELLALRPLYGATDDTPTPELMQRIQYEEPPRPGQYNRGVPADLEAIVLKCLEKDPRRRYATAAELADDLSRWLRGEAVRAQPPAWSYLAAKFLRRNRVVAGTAAFLLVALVLGNLPALYTIRSLTQENTQLQDRVRALEGEPHDPKTDGPSLAPGHTDAFAYGGWAASGMLLSALVGTLVISRLRRPRPVALNVLPRRDEPVHATAAPKPPDTPDEKEPVVTVSADGAAGMGDGVSLTATAGPDVAPVPPVNPTEDTEAFSSQTVVLHYPAPIAIAFRRFCQRKQPHDRLAQLFDTFEATVKYLVFLGLSDLLQCLARSGQPVVLPKGQPFAFLRGHHKKTLGQWLETLRETTKELGKQPDRFLRELPEVCQEKGYLDADLCGWLVKKRNEVHTMHNIALESQSADCRRLLSETRPKLERLFQEIRFVRRYPLGFALPGYSGEDEPGLRRYRIHSCMGARVATAKEMFPLEAPVELRAGVPFLAAPDDSAVLYLWPFLLQRESDRTQRPTLYAFQEVRPGAEHLARITSAAIDHEDVWNQDLCAEGAGDFEWLAKELRDGPALAALPAPLRLARGLAESLVGRLSGEMLGKKKANPLRLIGPIAKGGFGTIYDARDGRGGRVAVKVMETEEDFGQFPRFTREFEQLRKASSQHPNIIRCFDQGNDIIGWREYPWYSMEFAAGGDLGALIRERRARLDGALAWDDPEGRAQVVAEFRAIAGAVAYLHDNDIIHRDIKPANVLIVDGEEGAELRLADFGLVKEVGRVRTGETIGPGSTQGQLLGSLHYMAPEQEQGKDVGPAADVYSLGIVLAELAIGDRPLPNLAVAAGSTIEKNENVRRLPEPLFDLVRRCTDLDPSCRPPNAHTVLHEFDLAVSRCKAAAAPAIAPAPA